MKFSKYRRSLNAWYTNFSNYLFLVRLWKCFYSLKTGVNSELWGVMSVRVSWKTEKVSMTVIPSPIFSPDSQGNQNTELARTTCHTKETIYNNIIYDCVSKINIL